MDDTNEVGIGTWMVTIVDAGPDKLRLSLSVGGRNGEIEHYSKSQHYSSASLLFQELLDVMDGSVFGFLATTRDPDVLALSLS